MLWITNYLPDLYWDDNLSCTVHAYRAKSMCLAASATCTEGVAWLHACMTFSQLHFYIMISLELAQPVMICMMRTALGCEDPCSIPITCLHSHKQHRCSFWPIYPHMQHKVGNMEENVLSCAAHQRCLSVTSHQHETWSWSKQLPSESGPPYFHESSKRLQQSPCPHCC